MNVVMDVDESTGQLEERRARIQERLESGKWLVEIDGLERPLTVPRANISKRVRLPWKPRDLRDHFIVFWRCNAEKDEYLEDIRARRFLIQ